MKILNLKIQLLILIIMMPVKAIIADNTIPNSTFDHKQNRLLEIDIEIEKRWEKAKKSFAPYEKKSVKKIKEEFKKLRDFRKKLWYKNPNEPLPISRSDYKRSPKITHSKANFLSAFSYNCLDEFINASTILINGHHFIALREPRPKNLPDYFKLLQDNDVSILVRLNTQNEYFKNNKLYYWDNNVLEKNGLGNVFAKNNNIESGISYFYTNLWEDNKSVDVEELYLLVQAVRETYAKRENPGPIACHCAAGVGRTGTFIAAYVLANMLDVLEPNEISIEGIVLKLSIQRPNMVSVTQQYILLYEFVEYYLEQKRNLNDTESEIKQEF